MQFAKHIAPRGMVRIGTVEGMLASFLPDFLGKFTIEYPNIATSIVTVGSNDVAELTARHAVDLGFIFGSPPRSDLIELGIMRQPLCVVVPPHHSLAGRAQCSIHDLAGLGVVVPDLSFGIRQEVDRACAEARVKLEVICETNSLALACKLVTRAGLATFLPRYAVLPEVEAGILTTVPLQGKRLAATRVTLVQSATRPLSPASHHVADLLTSEISDYS
ncbi:substrate-binding domain-containing protein [Agrobacterium sp. NPDC089420]|uniref:substrate-binding domain-containing protein n=1 Tax=Agrobacterium sp. NPDC089420 TaxID=3363918 RepID=UPI00384D6748